MRRGYWKRISLGLLLLIALGEFSARGPVRAFRHSGFNDFISPYIQTKAWLRGSDPYDPQTLAKLWPSEAARPSFVYPESLDGTLPAKRGIPSPYPLTAFPLLAPLVQVHWTAAALTWTIFNITAFKLPFVVPSRLRGFRCEASNRYSSFFRRLCSHRSKQQLLYQMWWLSSLLWGCWPC